MSEEASHWKLGVFVIFSAILLAAVASGLGAGRLFRKTLILETVFDESTAGIDVDSPVKHRGVKVGTVSRIAFAGSEYPVGDRPEMAGLVVMELRLEEALLPKLATSSGESLLPRLVASGLRARIASTGFVAPPFVELAWIASASTPVVVPWTPRKPYVPSARSASGSVTEGTADLIASAKLTLADAKKAIEGVRGERVQTEVLALLADLRESVAQLAPAIADVRSVTATASRLTGENETALRAFLADLPETSKHVRALAERLDSDSTRKTLDDVARTSELLPALAVDLRRLVRRLDALVASQRGDVEATLTGLRQITGNVKDLSAEASKNPSWVLFGEPPPKVAPGEEPK